ILILSLWVDGAAQDGRSAGTAVPAAAPATMRLEPCRLANLADDVKCGKFEVYEDRAGRAGRKISLNIVVMPALTDKPAADPVFFLAGGPGQSVVAAIPVARKDLLAKIRRERDVVLVDQRGTGGSNPLNCSLFGDKNDMRGFFSDATLIG